MDCLLDNGAEAQPSLLQSLNTSRLLQLPIEIRLQIFYHLFGPSSSSSSTPRLIIRKASDIVPPICLVNHQVHIEALPIYIQSRILVPTNIDVLPTLTILMDGIPENKGFESIRKLNLNHFALPPTHAVKAMHFITLCSKLEDLTLTLDCREFTHPLERASITNLFHLDTIIPLPYLRTLRIDIDTSPEPLPPDPLQHLPMMRNMQRTKIVRDGVVVEKRRSRSMRAYTFYKGNDTVEGQVREWFKDRFREVGRDVEVLGDGV
ncbi:hypothetical protein BDV96DRAFT_653912 [Lophiotrema nucula]|uniref:F-box domain-containing protein n=1 Tax=Lophiotrema nucula TaxID=690887 RepID=A0A6A5YM75_9PLEO|nr:hypothetical protein BDV96DRAFT_653912 [Lophiotrema nucula]